jgi:sugar phosphate isomerase/epimerase
MYRAFSPHAIGFSVSFRDAVGAAARNGFRGYWFDLRTDAKQDVSVIRELLKAHEMRPAGFGLPVDFHRDEQTFTRDLNALPGFADTARALGLGRCTTWIAAASDELTYEQNFDLHRTRLRKVAEILEERDIRLGLEFVGPPSFRKGKNYEFVHNLGQTLELCTAIGTGNVGLLLDLFHWDLAGQTETDFNLIPNQEYIVLAHVNDAPAGRTVEEQLDNDRRLPGETGVLKIRQFLSGLARLGYDGPVVVEPFSAELKSMPFEKAVAATRESLQKVWLPGT